MKAERWTKKEFEEFMKKPCTIIYKHHFNDRYKNNTERQYAALLNIKKENGDIISWKYEPYHIRLADNTFIIPDFVVTTANGQEVHEVKGFERPAWKAKWKIFKEMFKDEFYRFLVCKKINGVWRIE
jgi:hypothetical protein